MPHPQVRNTSRQRARATPLTRYLAVASRFHTYSLNNQFLIAAQCPTATRVAGYQAWRRIGRWVRRGERGIVILAPITRRRGDVLTGDDALDDTEQTPVARVLGFRTTHVFDVLQTDGEPFPPLAQDAVGDPGVHLAALERAIADAGVKLTQVADLGGAHGCSRPGQIAVLESLTPADTASVLVHEFAHELMHQRSERPTSKIVRETEAEAVALHRQHGDRRPAQRLLSRLHSAIRGQCRHTAAIAAAHPSHRTSDSLCAPPATPVLRPPVRLRPWRRDAHPTANRHDRPGGELRPLRNPADGDR
jgi:N-terminal domain of anti-restriction factor ArdC